MFEFCRGCTGHQPENCPLSSLPKPRVRPRFFQSEIGQLFKAVENSETFLTTIRPMICDVENSELDDNQRRGRVDNITSTIFAELAYVYVREHMEKLNFKVLSPTLTENIFRIAGQTRSVTPDGLVLRETPDPTGQLVNRIVAVCEYTISKRPSYYRDKKNQWEAYKDGRFLEFINQIPPLRRHIVELMIAQEAGNPMRIEFEHAKYLGVILGLTSNKSTEKCLDKVGIKGFEHHIPILRPGLDEYVEHLFRVFREPTWSA